jgi:hypothetical protein
MVPTAATRRRALAPVTVAVTALLAACGSPAAPRRDGAGAIAKAGETRLLKLRVGDCMSNLRERLDNPDGGHNGVPEVRAVPCAAPHDSEILQITALDGKAWPGEAIVSGDAAAGTVALRERLDRAGAHGGARARQSFSLLTFKPIQQRWEFENQHAVFYVAVFAQPRRGRL